MTTNPGAIIIQLILAKIADDDIQAVTDNLARLPLSVIPKGQAEMLISWFLNQAAKSANVNAARAVITAFDVARVRTDPLPAITNIFLNPTLSRETLTFTIASFPEKAPIDFFVDLVNMGDDATALKAAGILTTYFPNLTNADWNMLVRLTDDVEEEEYENQLLRAYFQTKVSETGNYADRPPWIRDDLPESELPTVPEGILSVHEAVTRMLDRFKTTGSVALDGECEERFKEGLIAQYATSPIPAKICLASSVDEFSFFDDTLIFQEYGPVNTIYSVNPTLNDSTHDCVKYGGCRMLLCTEFEGMDANRDEIDVMAEEVIITDWFRGSCDRCLAKIRRRHYAVRRPLHHGGWIGCYCSLECMEEGVTDPMVTFMASRLWGQLTAHGIRERA